VVVAGVVVTGVVVLTTSLGELLSSSLLGSGVQVLNLSLTEDAGDDISLGPI
jgi:hypothetical protein